MNTDEEFLAAIAADYEDENLRSAYADWLEERGDERHEYIRLRVAIETGPADGSTLSRFEQLRSTLDRTWLRAVDPGSHRMQAAWSRLEQWFCANAPAALTPLRDGASESDLSGFEKSIGRPLPECLREWFRIHDGQDDDDIDFDGDGVIFGLYPLSIADSRREWEAFEDRRETVNSGRPHPSRPEDAILPGYWEDGWIPLLQMPGTGNYLGVDLTPGPTGTRGQVLNFGRDEHTHVVAAPNWPVFIDIVTDEYDSGHVEIQVDLYAESEDDDPDDPCFYYQRHSEMPVRVLMDMLVHLHEIGQFDGRRVHFRKDTMPN